MVLPGSGGVSSAVASAAATGDTMTMTDTSCASEWAKAPTSAGGRTFTITSGATVPGEVNLDNAAGQVVAEVESMAPRSSVRLSVTLGAGSYRWYCYPQGKPSTHSAPIALTGAAGPGPVAVSPVALSDLAGPGQQYETYAAGSLATLAAKVTQIQGDLRAGRLAAARTDWLQAQMDWELVGASYDSFGDLGQAVDGLPAGLPRGVADPQFTGLHRLEYGLWHGQDAATLETVATQLQASIGRVRANLSSPGLAGDPAQLPVRAHEILEDALRDHLSLMDNEGGGAGYAETYADAQVTRVVLSELAPLIATRAPSLVSTASGQLSALQSALFATTANFQWQPAKPATRAQRDKIDADIDATLETLSVVPDILEVHRGQ
jgi:high-affinity iron transporter